MYEPVHLLGRRRCRWAPGARSRRFALAPAARGAADHASATPMIGTNNPTANHAIRLRPFLPARNAAKLPQSS